LVVGTSQVWINTGSTGAHLDDVRVRQAIQAAIDVDTLNQRALGGAAIGSTSLVPKQLGLLKATKGPKYDPAQATKLLDEVKAQTGWDGSMGMICTNSTLGQNLGIAYQAMLNNVGFKINLDTSLTVSAFVQRANGQHNYDIACGGLQVNSGDYWTALYSKTSAPGNPMQFSNPEWSAALAQLAGAAIGTPAYQTAIEKVQALSNKYVPGLPTISYPEVVLMQSAVHGVEFTYTNIALFDKAWLSQK
jgi:peptide/nickel transport system substrate-binding protein